MKAVYVQLGDSIDYTPSAAVSAGDVVVFGTIIGIAKLDIAANTLGALAVDGVFSIAKGTGAITAGAAVYWDSTNKVITTTSNNNTVAGVAVAAAASDSDTVLVLINK